MGMKIVNDVRFREEEVDRLAALVVPAIARNKSASVGGKTRQSSRGAAKTKAKAEAEAASES